MVGFMSGIVQRITVQTYYNGIGNQLNYSILEPPWIEIQIFHLTIIIKLEV
jgi:hypothetical protein